MDGGTPPGRCSPLATGGDTENSWPVPAPVAAASIASENPADRRVRRVTRGDCPWAQNQFWGSPKQQVFHRLGYKKIRQVGLPGLRRSGVAEESRWTMTHRVLAWST
ncbi:hypothetical protein NDU88_002826 [Pleurodeles waltl]|uniref:Uncharacterized protein n=1 Tax=Pleurodeles waltl TaxID=8319 RepID=A0AAV7VCE9_PLEWA|nr:hypothetical protein NDU88_002826 [Pleurodeles waltl]